MYSPCNNRGFFLATELRQEFVQLGKILLREILSHYVSSSCRRVLSLYSSSPACANVMPCSFLHLFTVGTLRTTAQIKTFGISLYYPIRANKAREYLRRFLKINATLYNCLFPHTFSERDFRVIRHFTTSILSCIFLLFQGAPF